MSSAVSERRDPGNTAELVAQQLGARRVGPGKWQAKCPAHHDHSPSLTIRAGEAGKVLIRCWAGCTLAAVLETSGVKMASLFPNGPKPSFNALRSAQRARARRSAEASFERQRIRALFDRRERLEAITRTLGKKLSETPDGSEGDALTRLFHMACDRLHEVEFQMETYPKPCLEGLIL